MSIIATRRAGSDISRSDEMTLLERSVARHKALAHPVRQRLLAMLRPDGLCVCQMTAVLELPCRRSRPTSLS